MKKRDAHPLGQPMGFVLAGIRTVPRIRCSQTMNLYDPEVGLEA
jgi:hypothetical protein